MNKKKKVKYRRQRRKQEKEELNLKSFIEEVRNEC